MNVEQFLELADLLPEPLMMLDVDGRILAANGPARSQYGLPSSPESSLYDLVESSRSEIDSYLRSCARSRSPVPGSLKIRVTDGHMPCRVEGARLSSRQPLVLLRLSPHQSATQRFVELNRQLEKLTAEVRRRRSVESRIQEQVRLISFGRDVGRALSQDNTLDSMLRHCAELIVSHLDAAFARIWVLNHREQVLELRASAGMYTHLDGDHSRVPVGQLKIGMIAQEKKPHLTNSVIGDPRVNHQEWARREGMVAFAGYPLIIDGEVVGVMAAFARHELSTDVLEAMSAVATEIALGVRRKCAERDLEAKALALEEADRRKNEFLAMLAHELRNPLAPIRTGLDLIQLESTDCREEVDVMKQQVEHLVRLVDDLLDVSRIMQGRIHLRRTRFQVGHLLQRSVDTLRPVIEAAGQELTVDDRARDEWIHGDEVRLAQVITNLIQNASKYTSSQGQGKIRVASHCEGNRVVIRVADNGIGLHPDFLPRIFDLFSQADQSLDRSQGGLGIGLTLAHRLVSLHGGTLEAHSEGLDRGSVFNVRLDRAEAPRAASSRGRATAEHLTAHPCRILVVDDSRAAAKMLARLLSKSGEHEVKLAYDGESALQVADSFTPDLVFLDIGLPGLSGYDVARRLRQAEAQHDPLIVALTGYGTEDDRRRSREVGIDMHLVKPIGIKELATVFCRLGDESPRTT